MSIPVTIHIGDVVLEAELHDTSCAMEIARILPIATEINRWGDEFYFAIPLTFPPDETATVSVNIGDIGYWPPGRALAIFFGPTPMSTDQHPVPASEVNLVGRIHGDAGILKKTGAKRIRIEKSGP